MEKILKNSYIVWSSLWVGILMGITIWNPFEAFASVFGILAALMFTVCWVKIYKNVLWNEFYDYSVAFLVVGALGALGAFIIPCTYSIDIAVSWNTWTEYMLLAFVFFLILICIDSLVHESETMGKFKYLMYIILVFLLFVEVLGILGTVFHIYI